MQKLLSGLSEGLNSLFFAGIAVLAMSVSLPTAALAQDDVAPAAQQRTSGEDFYPSSDAGWAKVNALLVRHISPHVCFVNSIGKNNSQGTVPEGYVEIGGNMLSEVLPDFLGAGIDRFVIGSIVFYPNKDDHACGSLAIAYAKKFDIDAAPPAPAKKK